MVDIKRLKNARQSCALTQREVAEALGVARSTVLRWERGDNSPNNADLMTLAMVYQTTIQWLRGGSGEEPIKEQRRRDAAKTALHHVLEADHIQPVQVVDHRDRSPGLDNCTQLSAAEHKAFADRNEGKRLDAIAGRISLILRSRKDLQSVEGIPIELFQAMRAGLVIPNSALMYQLAEKAGVDPELFLIGS